LFHDVQFEILSTLRERGRLPVGEDSLGEALDVADTALDRQASLLCDELAPAIPRVWDDAIAGIRADLHEWLRRTAREERFVPERFELSFGLADRERAYSDPASVREPVPLECGIVLRGSIDLVEGDARQVARVTDHKTG